MNTTSTLDGSRLDLICWNHYGSLDDRAVEQVLDANPGLAMTPVLPAGRTVRLPELKSTPAEQSLW